LAEEVEKARLYEEVEKARLDEEAKKTRLEEETEKARLDEEAEKAQLEEETRLDEEQKRKEEQARLDEEANLAEETLLAEEAMLEEEALLAQDEWEASIRLAEQLDGKIAGSDEFLAELRGIEDLPYDAEVDKARWEEAERLAQSLASNEKSQKKEGNGAATEELTAGIVDPNEMSEEELGRLARAAVVQYEAEMFQEEKELQSDEDWEDDSDTEVHNLLNLEESEVEAPISKNNVSWEKMKVVQLKEELRSRGLKVSGRKAELLVRLQTDDAS